MKIRCIIVFTPEERGSHAARVLAQHILHQMIEDLDECGTDDRERFFPEGALTVREQS